MKRSALRLAAVALPVTALVLAAGGTASAHDDDDFLKSRIVVTTTHHHCDGHGPHGWHSSGDWSTSVSIETGMGGDLDMYND
ncbi:hypothetical protein ABT381_17215 [Streptomyces sp. NPDC000151]|uniref:hypothetical protein n=1 Tax=Streptomyces sp. NPDC000151 TaxID=3154244 RepID=UPI00332125DD